MNFSGKGRPKRFSSNFVTEADKWRSGRRVSRRNASLDQSDDDEDTDDETWDWTEELRERHRLGSTKSDQDVEVKLTRKQTLILSTLVPDEILFLDKFVFSFLQQKILY